MTRDDLGAVRAAVRRAADAGAARERDRLYAAIGRLAAEPLFAKADDPPAAPAPAPAPQPGGHVPPALMLAMVDHALECREWGDDPEPGLAALRKLVDDPRALARVLGESRVVTKAAWAAMTKAAGPARALAPPPAGTPVSGAGDATSRQPGQPWQGASGKWFVVDSGTHKTRWARADEIPGSAASEASVNRAAAATRPQSRAKDPAGAKSDAELEAMSPADRKQHARERVAVLTKKVEGLKYGKGTVTAADLHELGKHLGQLTHADLRSLRSTLQANLGGHHGAFGARRTHAGRVGALHDHLTLVAEARAKLADHARTASAAAKTAAEPPAPEEGGKTPAKPAVPASPIEAEEEVGAKPAVPVAKPGAKLPENGPVEIPAKGKKGGKAGPISTRGDSPKGVAEPSPAAAQAGAGLPENGPVELGPKTKPAGKSKPEKLPVGAASATPETASGSEKDKAAGGLPVPLHALAAAAHAGPGELLRVASDARAAANKTAAEGGHLATHDAITAAERGDHGPEAKAAVKAATAWENHEGNPDRKYMAVGRALAAAGFGKPAAETPGGEPSPKLPAPEPAAEPVDPAKEAFVRGEKPAPLNPDPDGGTAPEPSPDAPVPGRRPEPAETEADRVPWGKPSPKPSPKLPAPVTAGATAKDRQMAGVLAASTDPQMRAVAEHIHAGLPFTDAHAKVFGSEPESTKPGTVTTPGPGTPPPPARPKKVEPKTHDEGRVGRIIAAARAGTHGPALTAHFGGASEADIHEAAKRLGVHDTLPNKASEAGNVQDEAKRYADAAGAAKDSYRRAAGRHRADADDADRLPNEKVPSPASGSGWEVVPDDEVKRKPAKPTDGLSPPAPRPDTATGGGNAAAAKLASPAPKKAARRLPDDGVEAPKTPDDRPLVAKHLAALRDTVTTPEAARAALRANVKETRELLAKYGGRRPDFADVADLSRYADLEARHVALQKLHAELADAAGRSPDTALGGANVPAAELASVGEPTPAKPAVPPRPPLPTRPTPKGEPAPGDDMGRKAVRPAPAGPAAEPAASTKTEERANSPARPAPHSEAHARLRSAIDSSAGLSADQRAKYHAAIDRVAGVMPGAAHARIGTHLKKATFHPNTRNLIEAAVASALTDPTLSAKGRADLRRILTHPGKLEYGGAFTPHSGEIHVDGDMRPESATTGTHAGGFLTPHHTYAHELGHAIDGPNEELSKSPAWREAFAGEIDADHNPLTKYARKSPDEGFAEFARLVYASDVPHAQVEKEFPKATAFFKDRGLWPDKERTGPESAMPEQFTDRVPLAGGAHADATDPAKLSQSDSQVADKKQVADAAGKIAGPQPDAPHYAPERVRAMAEQARRVAGKGSASPATPTPAGEPQTLDARLDRLKEDGTREDIIAAAEKVGGPDLAAAVKKIKRESGMLDAIRNHLADHPEPDSVKFSMSDEEGHPEQVFARPDVRAGLPVREHDPEKDPPNEHPDAVRAAAHDRARAAGHDPADLDREAVRVAWEEYHNHPSFRPGYKYAGFHVPTVVRNTYAEAHERLDDRRDAAAVGATRPEDVLAHLEATAGISVEGDNSPHLIDGRAADAARKARGEGLDPAEVGAAAARHAARIARNHTGTDALHRGQVARLAYLAAHDEVKAAAEKRRRMDEADRQAAATAGFADAYPDLADDPAERARHYMKAATGNHDDFDTIHEEHLDGDTTNSIIKDMRRLPTEELVAHHAAMSALTGDPDHEGVGMARAALEKHPDVEPEPLSADDDLHGHHLLTEDDGAAFHAARDAAAKLPGAARALGLGDGAVLVRDGSPLHRALAAGLGDGHKWGGLGDDHRMADLFGSLKSGRQVPQSAVPASAKNYGTTAGALNPDVVEDDDWNPQAVDVYRRLTPDLYVRRKSDGTAEDDDQFDIVHRRDVPPLSNLPDAYWADFDHAPNHDADIETREQQRQAKEVPDNVETFRDRSGSVVNRMHQDATGEFLTTRSLASMKEAIADHRRRVNAARQAWHAALAGVPDGDRPEEPDWHDVDASALEESYDSRREHFDALDKLNSAYWTHADEAEAAVDEAKAVATAFHRKHSLRGVRAAADGMSPARRARIALDALGLPHKHLTDEQAAAFHDQMQALHARFAPPT